MSEIGVASGGPWQGSLILASAPQPRYGKSLMTRSQPRAHPDGGPTAKAAPVSTCDRRPRVSLALGGGGGRGITHLGVLQAFSECNVPVERISGISIGAIAGALYATGQGIGEIHQQVLAFIESPEFRRRQGQMFGATPARGHGAGASSWLSRFKRIFSAHQTMTRAIRHAAILPSSVLQHVVDTLLPDINIEDAEIPLSIVALDLRSGQRVVLDRGPLREAVRASASIPGVFPPVPWEDQLLCDIGVFESIPVITAKEYASDRTIAVDVSDQVAPVQQCKNILEVFSRVQHLAECELRQHSLVHADIVIRPAIGRRPWFDFSLPSALIALGYQAAREQLSDLLRQANETTAHSPAFAEASSPVTDPPPTAAGNRPRAVCALSARVTAARRYRATNRALAFRAKSSGTQRRTVQCSSQRSIAPPSPQSRTANANCWSVRCHRTPAS